MRVGIAGAGRIGQAVATRLVTAGHEVMLSNTRGPESLADIEESLGQDAHAGTVSDAAGYGEVVVVAIPAAAMYDLPEGVAGVRAALGLAQTVGSAADPSRARGPGFELLAGKGWGLSHGCG